MGLRVMGLFLSEASKTGCLTVTHYRGYTKRYFLIIYNMNRYGIEFLVLEWG